MSDVGYVLLIHGNVESEWLIKIISQIKHFHIGFKQIVLVSYKSDYDNYNFILKSINCEHIFNIVVVEDLINPGFFNINRQLHQVWNGLQIISDDDIVFKLRNDQSVDFNKVIKYIDDDRIITTNCFSRKDRLYHPSDMFLVGKARELKLMYSMPLQYETHIMVEMKNRYYLDKHRECNFVFYSPESDLSRYFLLRKGWSIKNTHVDSYDAINKFYKIANSWNIDFRWKKKRTYLYPSGSIILPHYFKIKPFAEGPIENASCYCEHDFGAKLKARDLYFIFISKFIWTIFSFKNNLKNMRGGNKFCILLKYRVLKIFPYFLVYKKINKLRSKLGKK